MMLLAFSFSFNVSVAAQIKSLYEMLGKDLPAYGTPARTAMAVEAGITSGYIGSYDQNQKIAEFLQSKKVTVKNTEIEMVKNYCLKLEKSVVVPNVKGEQNIKKLLSTNVKESIANAEINSIDVRINVDDYQSMQCDSLLMLSISSVVAKRTSDEEILKAAGNKFFTDISVRQTLIYLLGKQPHGEKGILATNSNSNIFYVKKVDGSIYYISLGWSTDYGGWYLNYHDWITPTGSEWEYRGDKVFSFVYNPKNPLTSFEDSEMPSKKKFINSILANK